ERKSPLGVERVDGARQMRLDDRLKLSIRSEDDHATVLGAALQPSWQLVGAAATVAKQRRPAGAALELVIELELESLNTGVVNVRASEDFGGRARQRVLAPGPQRDVDPRPPPIGDSLSQLGRQAARHREEAGAG